MIKLGTKAETLERLTNRLKYSKVLPQISFTVWEWQNRRKDIIDAIYRLNWFSDDSTLIVRSSSLNEDIAINSMAGKYLSLPNIKGKSSLEFAVQEVIESYDDNDSNNQVLIQPMLKRVKMSGVAFTLDPSNCGNYYVINYDNVSGRTDTITSGCSNVGKVFYCFKGKMDCLDNLMKNLCIAFNELEELFQKDNLDIEFALTENSDIYILQVRELMVHDKICDIVSQINVLARMETKLKKCDQVNPFLYGSGTLFGQMPDWNISEILGVYPKPLSLSIFCEIAAYTSWSQQRKLLGYKNVQGFPLIIDFWGIPYVNVLVSFNSLLPNGINEETGKRLIDFYLGKLKNNRILHDKVEFDILYTCYVFDTTRKIDDLRKNGFNEDEINNILLSLKEITVNMLLDKNRTIRRCYEMLDVLGKRNKVIINSNMRDEDKVYWLIEDCKEYGIPAFVGLARVGFVASQLLLSMVNVEILNEEQYEDFLNCVSTVNKKMTNDFNNKSKKEFLKIYGFLRPGTYDITSECYYENPEIYFDWKSKKINENKEHTEKNKETYPNIDIKKYMEEIGVSMSTNELFDFIKQSIEGREMSKFLFTKNVSDSLTLIAKIGEELGYSREDCSYLDIKIFSKNHVGCFSIDELFKLSIKKGKEKFAIEKGLRLPSLITGMDDLYFFEESEISPNFITNKKIIGKTIFIKPMGETRNLENKILLIPYADPGYDWIFTKKIAGFITKFGGINSHMAIRAHELGIPCVLGVGEMLFEQYCNVSVISIDAKNKKIEIIS